MRKGSHLTEEHKRKIGKFHKGRLRTEEHKANLRKALQNPERCRKISEAKKEYWRKWREARNV